nr:putative colanic acid biosynthesis acetyltransferase [Rhodococcus sp. DK17]
MTRGTHPDLSLSAFSGVGYDKGRNKVVQLAWMAISGITMQWWVPSRVRNSILRAFGAHIGENVLIRHRVRIHWPWKLNVGENSWIGEGVWILNLEPVSIGANVCVSQDVTLCTGSHQRQSPSFEFDNAPIRIDDGAWICIRATVLRGVRVGPHSVVGATALVSSDVSAGEMVTASPGNVIRK